MAARKKTAGKKAGKKAAPKPAKKAGSRAGKAASNRSAAPAASRPAAPKAGPAAAADVNLGHILGLKPRTHTGFKPEAFLEAKRLLANEPYATIQDAARAVAEKAVELSNKSGPTPFPKP